MISTAWSEAGSPKRPNEDWYGISERLKPSPTVVLDGGTARTDTGCVHSVVWYVQQLGEHLLRAFQSDHGQQRQLPEILASEIRNVADLHSSTCDLTHPGTPSAAVAIIRPTGPHQWEYAVLGDVTVVFDTPTGEVVIVDQRISQSASAQRAEADRWPTGSPEKEDALVAMKHAELAERNKEYWIAAADPAAAEHSLTGSVEDVRRLAVLTDGAARAVAFGIMTWRQVLQVMAAEGPARVINQVRSAETSDPTGQRWPRNKQSDDATAVYVGPTGI
jgi:hypothetical protein